MIPITDNEAQTDGREPPEGTSWPVEDDEVILWVSERRKKAENRLGDWYDGARKEFGFTENRQWDDTDIAKLEAERRLAVTFNRIAPIVNSICGQEVANRQEVKFLPRRVGEVSTADPMNDAVKWVRDNCNAEDEDSDAFRDMVICGMGWTCSRMDYEVNPDGEPRIERRDPTLMRWDPTCRRKNLADAKWIQSDYWMTREAIESRWPGADMAAMVNLSGPDERGEPHDATEAWKYKNDQSGKEIYADQWRVIHHVERFTRTIHRVIDPTSGKMGQYSEEDFAKISGNAEKIGLKLQSQKSQQRVYWEAWTVGKVNLASGIAKIQKDFQYQCMTGTREHETGYWFGIVRPMMDPQRYANRLGSLLMSVLATNAKGGLNFETGAFANQQKALSDWSRWDSSIEFNEGALTGGKVQPRTPAQLPQGATEFMQFAIGSLRDVTGVNLELLGMRQDDQPGVVESMRTKAGLTILASIFDAMRLYRKRQGVILAEFVDKFLSDGRLIRILGPEGQKFLPLLRNPDTVDYDVIVDESPASRDVKERTWMVLSQIGPMLMEMGIKPPIEALDYAPIPESLTMAFKKSIAQAAQQPPPPNPLVQKAQVEGQNQMQLAQMKAQLEQQLEQSRAQTTRMAEAARLEADVGVAQHAATVKAQVEQQRIALEMRLKEVTAQQEQEIALRKAVLDSETKLRVAEISAGMPPELPEERQARVQQETTSIQQIAQAMMDGHAQLLNAVGQQLEAHRQGMAQIAQQMANPKPRTVTAPSGKTYTIQ